MCGYEGIYFFFKLEIIFNVAFFHLKRLIAIYLLLHYVESTMAIPTMQPKLFQPSLQYSKLSARKNRFLNLAPNIISGKPANFASDDREIALFLSTSSLVDPIFIKDSQIDFPPDSEPFFIEGPGIYTNYGGGDLSGNQAGNLQISKKRTSDKYLYIKFPPY